MPNREIKGDTEGFGMVFIEAAACGKPTIAGTAGGTGAAVVHGVTGLQVDGNSARDLKEAVAGLLRDATLAQTMSRAGYNRTREDFAWQLVAERVNSL